MHRLIRKLEALAPLLDVEKNMLRSAVSAPRHHKSGQVPLTDTPPNALTLILEGFACRYKPLGGGRRLILNYFVAGDICGLRLPPADHPEYCLGTFGPAETATLSAERILSSPERYPNLNRALWWSALAEQSIAREWITNVGHRTAYERVAHLLCEMFTRLQLVGLTRENRCMLPLTQRDLADALSLSSVHVNRVLRQMRADELMTFRFGQMTLHDPGRLQAIAGFDPMYLRLQAPRESNDSPVALRRR